MEYMEDPQDEYAFWCELNACPSCDGIGEDDDPLFHCEYCDGTGIDPSAEYTGPDPI
jgi:hypothetical protein